MPLHVRPLAGGTDLLVDLKHTLNGPQVLVDIGRVPELKGIEKTPEGLRIGALVTQPSTALVLITRGKCDPKPG